MDFAMNMVKRLETMPKLNITEDLVKSMEPRIPAKWSYERLVQLIIAFEKELTADEEIGGRFVNAPIEGAFHIEDLGFWGPDMIIFHGKNTHGRPVQLIQHYSQMNVLLTALPKESMKPRRIGFMLEQRNKQHESEPAEPK
jgi:hypothetical protein